MGIKVEFEGVDGSGKTTALKYFISRLKEAGRNVIETCEVGNPNIPACVKLREFVLDPASNLSGEAMEMIFSAMRFENDRWMKTLPYESIVVSDRGWLSHLAYTDHNVDRDFTRGLYLNLMKQRTDLPDVIVYFKIDTQTALKRRTNRQTSDVIEAKGIEFQEKVRESFERYIRYFKSENAHKKVYEIDANGSIDSVRMQIDFIIEDLHKTGRI